MKWVLLAAGLLILASCVPGGLPPLQGCPEDAKACPDGTAVGRLPPDCRFAPCPNEAGGDQPAACTQPGLKYVSRDPQECVAVLYECVPGTAPFTNDCGCGCRDTGGATQPGECNFADPDRKYVGKSPEECSRIRFVCEADSEYFADECGCGCKKAGDSNGRPGGEYRPCEEDARNKGCTKEYDPVCATVDTGLRCVRAPCDGASEKKTYGNACDACSDPKVYGWTPGACEEDRVACPADARLCPDGTAVGRLPPDCRFAPCPPAPSCESKPGESKKYYARSPGDCALMQIDCTFGSKYFTDACGCGCVTGWEESPQAQSCSPASRKVDVCTQDEMLVCASNGKNYGNACKACRDPSVDSWVPGPCPDSRLQEHYCSADDRRAEACIAIYKPVCGWYDPAKVQCVRYPCAKDFSSSCHACGVDQVLYWTSGKCPGAQADATGTLSGKVAIGPLCPVEPCEVTIDQRLMAYGARQVGVYERGQSVPAKTIRIRSDGRYAASLAEGEYTVDILPRQTGVGGASGVPKDITVKAGETVTVDIDIDTGIR